MKKLITIGLLLTAFFSFSQDKESSVKDAISDVVSGVVSFSKDALSGINQGIEKGRQDGESIDGARIISSPETLAKYDVVLSIGKVNKTSDDSYEIVMTIRNNEGEPIRFINLFVPLKVILLDENGFSSNLANNYLDVTVPAKAAIKSAWKFYHVEAKPTMLRIYDQEIKIPVIKQ